MLYITFDEYLEMGGVLSNVDFLTAEASARAIVDRYTLNRIAEDFVLNKTSILYMYQLKHLMFELIQINNIYKNNNITSESNEGISVTYSVLKGTEKQDEYEQLIYNYLANYSNSEGVSLLFRGV